MRWNQPTLPVDWSMLGGRRSATRDLGVEGASPPPGKLTDVAFRFVDLFAGIGGFHATLGALEGECRFASEIDPLAKRVYERNWGTPVVGDIVPLTESRMAVPEHDVLAAGFPCQPFSKSGLQLGMDETRGTLFWNICRVLEVRRPPVIILENVRNLIGPRHRDTWATIVTSLRNLGYRVSGAPTVFSPHLLPRELGGRPQSRDRVFITGTYVGRRRAWEEASSQPLLARAPVNGWDPHSWDVTRDLPLEEDSDIREVSRYQLTSDETYWVSVWDEFVRDLRPRLEGGRLPGFPLWESAFVETPQIGPEMAPWEVIFRQKNSAFYRDHRSVIDAWRDRNNGLAAIPASRRKLEWQAQDAASLWETVLHFRPSGIRAKKPTYLPALVAITQTSVVAGRRRRITPREAARLQGLPDWFDFGVQPDSATYRQLGNGVNVGAAYYVFRQHVLADQEDIGIRAPELVEAVTRADQNPDVALAARRGTSRLRVALTEAGALPGWGELTG